MLMRKRHRQNAPRCPGFLSVLPVFVLASVALAGCRGTPAPDDENSLAIGAAADRASTGNVTLPDEFVRQGGIDMEPVREHVLMPSFRAPARVTYNADTVAHVGTPVVGRVLQIRVKLGDVVKQGDDLLVIESRELGEAQGDYLQKLAAGSAARDAAEAPKVALERAKSLEGGAISSAEVRKREAEYHAAMGSMRNADVALAAAEQKLRLFGLDETGVRQLAAGGRPLPHYSIRAPITGTVIQREVTLGELVIPEKETLLVLADLSTFWVVADVPEDRLKQVVPGARVRIHVAPAPGQPVEGTVSLISPGVDPSTRTVEVRVEVQASRASLMPGMFAEAEIFDGRSEASRPVLAIPETAINTIDGESVVFVPAGEKQNTFAKRAIERGREVGGMVQVLSGLQAGEKIVTRGSLILKGQLQKTGAGEDDD